MGMGGRWRTGPVESPPVLNIEHLREIIAEVEVFE
jgi:hypothetical protein